jgi:hypothetical protein
VKRLLLKLTGRWMMRTHGARVQEGYIIHIGQLVQVRAGDTLDKLAARFGTTLRQVSLDWGRWGWSGRSWRPGYRV